MRISSSSADGSTTLRIHSRRLDAPVARELQSSLGEAISSLPGPAVIDLSDVAFMDSSGLGALIAALKTVDRKHLTIAGVAPAVRTAFRLARVDRAFTIVE